MKANFSTIWILCLLASASWAHSIEDEELANLPYGSSLEVEEIGEDFAEQWIEMMKGTRAEDFTSFDVSQRSEERLSQYVSLEQVPLEMAGMYFVSSSKGANIDFSIKDPLGKEIFERKGEHDGVFRLVIKDPGFYTLIISNRKVNSLFP